MFTRFEEHAAASMLGHPDSPPRLQGQLHFDRPWERQLFGLALSLSKAGCFEWETFRQHLIEAIAQWEDGACPGQPRWDYYRRFLAALERTLLETRLLAPGEIADDPGEPAAARANSGGA
ncbi:nitrile hydratase accessory protein [Burkholderia gladioli]|uniref:nitrile hydratase accessory protein n=1 Tax=Burkholderia gladioli TaxID=28095 RepID=UPI0038B2C454